MNSKEQSVLNYNKLKAKFMILDANSQTLLSQRGKVSHMKMWIKLLKTMKLLKSVRP